ncbi:chemokine-like factor [Genypterus blacodes]|uniref:chemokine-like factor n=1 Tax=Genypterus blacodes TaxID=154954 RepID=UPI003F776061
MEVDTAFFKSRRGVFKLTEMVTLFVAFVCFTVASRPKYIAATALEFVITFLLLLLYVLKLNKKFTFFFWPLIDAFNSVFGAVLFTVLSLIALSTYSVRGTLAGGIVGLMSAVVLCVDSAMLCKNITLNKLRSGTQIQKNQE